MPKSTKKPKDKNAPKKNQSSYFIFCGEHRAEVAAANKGKPVTQVAKDLAAKWKKIDPQEKKDYEAKAADQKKKYLVEFEKYKKTANYGKYILELQEWKESVGSMAKKKGKGPKKPKQPETMPKRPQSSYFVFSNKIRPQLREKNPDKKITEIAKMIAAEWKTVDKKVYEKQAAKFKEKYLVEIEKYKKTEEYSQYQEKLDEWKAEKKRFDKNVDAGSDDDGEPLKVKLPRKPKDENCPKKPMSSYFVYAKAVREKIKNDNPDMAVTQIAKEIGKKWKLLTEAEKKPFEKDAARLKEEYKKVAAKYDGSEQQKEFAEKLEAWKLECAKRKKAAKEKREKAETKKGGKDKKKKKASKRKFESDSESSSESESSSDSESDSSSGSESDSDESSSDDSDSSSE